MGRHKADFGGHVKTISDARDHGGELPGLGNVHQRWGTASGAFQIQPERRSDFLSPKNYEPVESICLWGLHPVCHNLELSIVGRLLVIRKLSKCSSTQNRKNQGILHTSK